MALAPKVFAYIRAHPGSSSRQLERVFADDLTTLWDAMRKLKRRHIAYVDGAWRVAARARGPSEARRQPG